MIGSFFNMRIFVFSTALIFIGFLAFMTIFVAVQGSFSPIVLTAFAILALLMFGIIGALLDKPKK